VKVELFRRIGMKTSILVAAAAAITLLLGTPGPASADTKVRIYLGVPHYSYRVAPDYRYRSGYGWYRPRAVVAPGKMSCGAARDRVRGNGYRNVSTVECGGTTFTFTATRNGKRVKVFVNSRTGGVWRG
jgi:hypothetical protein